MWLWKTSYLEFSKTKMERLRLGTQSKRTGL